MATISRELAKALKAEQQNAFTRAMDLVGIIRKKVHHNCTGKLRTFVFDDHACAETIPALVEIGGPSPLASRVMDIFLVSEKNIVRSVR